MENIVGHALNQHVCNRANTSGKGTGAGFSKLRKNCVAGVNLPSYEFRNWLSAIFEALICVNFEAIHFVKLRTVETFLSRATQYVGASTN